jgi:Rieske Fe-S protein
MNRRTFLKLTATTLTGSLPVTAIDAFAARPARAVDAGPASKYATEGVYGNFRDQGFFLVRKGAHLAALSAFCTHRKCKLIAESNRSFYCNCHGSTFDLSGKVTLGPAKRDLPILPAVVDERGHLLVTVAVTDVAKASDFARGCVGHDVGLARRCPKSFYLF